MWLLSEQSDMEANECWLNRWVVALLHWRGFAGDMMHCLTELVGWQWGCSVGWCIQSRSAMHRQNTGGGDTRSIQNLDWCLHHSSTAPASLHWHFMTIHNVSVRPPRRVHWDRGCRRCVTEWALCCWLQQHFFFWFMDHIDLVWRSRSFFLKSEKNPFLRAIRRPFLVLQPSTRQNKSISICSPSVKSLCGLVFSAGGLQQAPGGGGHHGHPPGRSRSQQGCRQDPGWLPRPHDP